MFLPLFKLLFMADIHLKIQDINDSLINPDIWNAKFSYALKLIEQYKQQQITGEEKALLFLKESDVHLKLGNIDLSEELLAESKSIISTLINSKPLSEISVCFTERQLPAVYRKEQRSLCFSEPGGRFVEIYEGSG